MKMRAIPVLRISESTVAEGFYRDQLGFEVKSTYRPSPDLADPCYMVVHRDGAWIHLSSFSGDGASGSAVYVLVADIEAVHRELVGRGLTPSLAPTDQSWGNRETYVEDPDGNSIRFVQEA